MNELMDILKELKPEVDFEKEDKLIDNSILDSFDVVQLITQLNDTFDIEISPDYIGPENFNSAKAMWAMIQKLQ